MASIEASRPAAAHGHYAAAKAGVMALTRCAAVEAAPHGIRINAVAPSLAMHPFLAKVTTDDLLAQVWGAEYVGQPQVVYVHIRWLREKIETDPATPQRIVTVRNLGYKFIPKEI